MFDFNTLAHRISVLTRRSSLLLSVAAAVLLFASNAHAQFGAPSGGTHVNDASLLHPPTGARVAIVEFSDFECPACAHANPTVMAAAATYKIPWVRHDFLIPGHPLVRPQQEQGRGRRVPQSGLCQPEFDLQS